MTEKGIGIDAGCWASHWQSVYLFVQLTIEIENVVLCGELKHFPKFFSGQVSEHLIRVTEGVY